MSRHFFRSTFIFDLISKSTKKSKTISFKSTINTIKKNLSSFNQSLDQFEFENQKFNFFESSNDDDINQDEFTKSQNKIMSKKIRFTKDDNQDSLEFSISFFLNSNSNFLRIDSQS